MIHDVKLVAYARSTADFEDNDTVTSKLSLPNGFPSLDDIKHFVNDNNLSIGYYNGIKLYYMDDNTHNILETTPEHYDGNDNAKVKSIIASKAINELVLLLFLSV